MTTPLRVLYVFTARKRALLVEAARGAAPDTLLFGFNHLHLAGSGIAPEFHEPEYPSVGRAVASQVGRLGPDFLQLRTLRRFPAYDVVFLTGGWPLLLAARAIPRRRRPKLVWLNMTLTNLLRRPHPTTGLIRLALRQADRVVCVAHHQQSFLRRTYGWREARVPLALSGTDATFYRPPWEEPLRKEPGPAAGDVPAAPPAPARPGTVLAPGRDAGRDYATLLRALPARAALRLVCSRSNLAGLALPARASVRYDIPAAALRQEYARSDVVAIPTHGDDAVAGSDCSGTLVLLDALAMGRPAVISQRASVGDYVTPGEHALTVPPGDPVTLHGALEHLLADDIGSARLADAGREHVLASLTTAHFARRLAEVFHQVTSETEAADAGT